MFTPLRTVSGGIDVKPTQSDRAPRQEGEQDGDATLLPLRVDTRWRDDDSRSARTREQGNRRARDLDMSSPAV